MARIRSPSLPLSTTRRSTSSMEQFARVLGENGPPSSLQHLPEPSRLRELSQRSKHTRAWRLCSSSPVDKWDVGRHLKTPDRGDHAELTSHRPRAVYPFDVHSSPGFD